MIYSNDDLNIYTSSNSATMPTDEEMHEDLSDRYDIDYDYSFRIKHGFAITAIGEHWYAMPDKEEDISRWFVKCDYPGIIAFGCFRNLTNRQRIIDTLCAAFPNEHLVGSDSITECATYIYNKVWFAFNQNYRT